MYEYPEQNLTIYPWLLGAFALTYLVSLYPPVSNIIRLKIKSPLVRSIGRIWAYLKKSDTINMTDETVRAIFLRQSGKWVFFGLISALIFADRLVGYLRTNLIYSFVGDQLILKYPTALMFLPLLKIALVSGFVMFALRSVICRINGELTLSSLLSAGTFLAFTNIVIIIWVFIYGVATWIVTLILFPESLATIIYNWTVTMPIIVVMSLLCIFLLWFADMPVRFQVVDIRTRPFSLFSRYRMSMAGGIFLVGTLLSLSRYLLGFLSWDLPRILMEFSSFNHMDSGSILLFISEVMNTAFQILLLFPVVGVLAVNGGVIESRTDKLDKSS